MNDTALLLCDLQNDFIHPDGAYGRAGLGNADIAAVVPRLRPLVDAVRAAGGWVVSTHFTLVPGKAGEEVEIELKKRIAVTATLRSRIAALPGVAMVEAV